MSASTMTKLSERFLAPPTKLTPVQEDMRLDFSTLTEAERGSILAVLERDSLLRKEDSSRIYRLKSELSFLRRRGAIRTEDEESFGDRACGRCRVELGFIINRGAPCRACRQKVCKQCREYSVNGRDWVCLVCHKQIEIQRATGEWMNEFIRRPSRRRDNKVYVPPADVVKRSLIKRSWTISSPPSGGRTSPEFRAHASRPVVTPRRPPRGSHPPTDENEPPWDAPLYPTRGAYPRRYSMSSFDGVPSSSRPLKGPAPLPPQEHNYQGASSPSSSPQRYSSPGESPVAPARRRLLPDLPQQPTRAPPCKPLRPSTLPRKLKERESRDTSRHSPPPSSCDDPNRFHSMPRTRTRSPSGQGRGRSEPPHRAHSPVMPMKPNTALGGYISSGPVTSTPIKHDPGLHNNVSARESTPTPPTPAPRDLSRPPANGRPPDQVTPTNSTSSSTSSSSSSSSLRRIPQLSSPAGNPPSRPESEGSVYTPKILTHRIEVEGGSLGRPTRRRDGGDISRTSSLEVETHLMNHKNRIPISRPDSGVSGSSRGGTSDNSDYDGDGTNSFHKVMGGPRPRQAASPAGLTSGYATTGRRPAKPTHNIASVRRSRSFQVGSRRLEEEFSSRSSPPPPPLPLKDALSGQVARYVKELEKGIQMTVENMKPIKKPPLPPGDLSQRVLHLSKDSHPVGRSRSLGRRQNNKPHSGSSPSDTSDTGNSKMDFDDRSTLPHSDHSSSNNRHSDTASDIVLDNEKIVPGGDDYKIVFISSDSSKDSELNSSIDSDNSGSPSRRVSSVNTINDSDTAGFIDESDWDYFESESQAGRRRKNNTVMKNNTHNNNKSNNSNVISAPRVIIPTRVDACVMTEGEYLSGSASEGEESEMESPSVQDTSLHLSLRVPSPDLTPCHQRDDSGVSNATTESQELQVSFDGNTTPVKDTTDDRPSSSSPPPLLPTLRSLDSAELHAMLRQTEAVQAEAQALQAALMGAFTPAEGVLSAIPGGGRWFARGDSTRSSAERSVGELSCHDQVRALGVNTPQESTALREYRKRVLTEIQNYYGVSSDMSGVGSGGGRAVGGAHPAHVKPRPDWHSYRAQHHLSQISTANVPKVLSPLSYQPRRADKRVPGSHDNAGTVHSRSKSVPSSGCVSNIRQKGSRDICIQTDPDPGGLVNHIDDDGDSSTPERIESTPSTPGAPPTDIMVGSRTQRDTTAAKVSRLVERIPTGTQGFTRPSGHSVGGGGGVRDGVGHFGSVGVGFRERGVGGGGGGGRGGGGDDVGPSILPHPPSIHLHLTLSRETSVAHPSDSETDEKLLDASSCVSSDLGGESASDFEYQEDASERWRRTRVQKERHGVDNGAGGRGSQVTKKAHNKEAKEHGGGGQGEEEAPLCPRITAAAAAAAVPATTTTNTNAQPPTTHNIRPHPPQPAPRKTMSALRPQLPSHPSLHQPPPPHLQENGGDLDALEGIIPSMETSQSDSSHPPLVLEAAPPQEEDEEHTSASSNTSEDEDTDEDVHVSRSYNICGADEGEKDSEAENIPEDEVPSHLEAENREDSSASSGSDDTDDEKHVSKEYRLTKSSSTESTSEETVLEGEVEEVDKNSCLGEGPKDEDGVKGEAGSDSLDMNVDESVVKDDEEVNNQVLSDLIINNNNNNNNISNNIVTETLSSSNISDNNSYNNSSSNNTPLPNEMCETSAVSDKVEEEQSEKGEEKIKDAENSNAKFNPTSEIGDNRQQQECETVAIDRQNLDLSDRGINVDSSSLNGAGEGGDGVGDSQVVLEDGSVSEEGEVVEKHDLESTSESIGKESKSEMKLNEINTNKDESVGAEVSDTVEKSENGGEAEKGENKHEDVEKSAETNDDEEKESVLEKVKETILPSDETSDLNANTSDSLEITTADDASVVKESLIENSPDGDQTSGITQGEEVTSHDETQVNKEPKEADVADVVVSEDIAPEVSEGLDDRECQVVPEGTGHVSESDHPISQESEGPSVNDAESKEAADSLEGENHECTGGTSSADAGSAQVEQSGGGGTEHTSVTQSESGDEHVPLQPPPPLPTGDDPASLTAAVPSSPGPVDTGPDIDSTLEEVDSTVIENGEERLKEGENNTVEGESSESGHSSAGESEVEGEDPANVVKINVTEQEQDGDGVSIPVSVLDGDGVRQEVTRFAVRRVRSPEVTSRRTPPVPSRRTKRSSSSDGVSSSSDIERSDADASDSADTVIEGGKLHTELRRFALQQRIHDHDDKSRDSDGPSSADSVLHGADSESQCSDNSEEGNLVSIVSVGDDDDHTTRLSSHGRIYIRSDSTDSDVQIKPTCIVVTGSSGAESGDDGEADDRNHRNIKNGGNDVTILEVTSDGRCGHVMSVHVTSPDSSRSASPARRSQVSELQSMILTTRERQSQFRRSPTELKESSSSLANYFTRTLGTDSPHAPRRLNKTPEIRRRKIDRTETVDSPATTSPSSPAATPDHSEGDLLAYEENHGINIEDEYPIPHDYDSGEDTERGVSFPDETELFNDDVSFDETRHEFPEGDEYEGVDLYVDQDAEGRFDSIEDGESINSESNYSESSGDEIMEREDELRGYCNRAIDFTLHTIIEESCEESDYERKTKEEEGSHADPSELEKYFYFGLGNGPADPKRFANEESEYSDTFSETSSSIFSEGVDVDPKYDEDIDPAELASSRLEKYFLTGLIGFERQPSIRSVGEDSELHTDESGSVGSDSEGSPSPEQPRKKLVRRPRGFRPGVANRGLVTSDRGDGAPSDGSHHSEGDEVDRTLVSGEDEGSTESEETAFDKGDGQFDTIKRRKKKKSSSDYSDKRSDSDKSELRGLEHLELEHKEDICDLKNAETLKSLMDQEKIAKRVTIDCDKDKSDEKVDKEGDLSDRKYQSRDSGFIGSSDDLLKDKPEDGFKDQKARSSSESSTEDIDNLKRKDEKHEMTKNEENKSDSFDNDSNNNKSENEDRSSGEGKVSRSSTGSSVDLPPFSNKARSKICRKDSFNNWSSDEETNMMMNKMRAFFKTMISNTREAPKGQRVKPPQLVAFEAKLTNLMKTVPGINDEQVKEIVEYLSSEDTWSDSYDSSDYTSSDLEGAYALLDQADPEMKSDLREQISASCKQIIQKFDQSREPSDTDSAHSLFGGRAYSESSEDASPSSKDTEFMYNRLMSSISHLKPDSDRGSIGSGSQGASPPLLAKVMHHIGNRLVALMHEVSGGSENGDEDSLSLGHPATSSPKVPLFKPRKHKSVDSISLDSSIEKSSLTSTSFESEDSPTDTEQSPESDPGTPKARKRLDPLSVISERSSAEDFTSLESQRTVFASHDSPRHQTRLDATHTHQTTASQRSLEERGVTNIQYFVTEGSNNEVEVWQSVTIDEDKFDAREHGRRSARRQETRKAKSHMSLEKIHQEDVKNTGERSESLGDLLDRVRSSEFSSSYEQLDSDSTLKASDSLDRHIGSSSSNIRLNASSRGSLTTSSRGSLAASSRGSLNAGSRGSLQGSSGPEEEEEKKSKKLSFFRYARRSSMPDTSKDNMSPEVRSTTLPRSNPTQVASTASLPRSQSALFNKTMPSITSTQAAYSSPPSTFDRLTGVSSATGPRSARYHAPGYKPPPPPATPKKTISSGLPASLRKDLVSSWAPQDESTGSLEEGIGQKSGSPSPLVGSVGRTSGRESAGSLASSTDNSTVTHPDEDIERLMQISEKKRNSLTPLGSRSESMASVCSAGAEGRYGTVVIKGEIELGLQYNYKEGHLECHVVQCRDLAAVDTKRNRSDPYVKVYLLPDKSKSGKRKTKVKKHTLNPVFEEVLKFSTASVSELNSRTLSVSVWHSDMFGRNDFLGEVIIALAGTVFDDVTPKWYPLQDRTEPMEDMSYSPRGDLIIALKFVPPDAVSSRKARRSRGALHVLVKEAKSLAAARPHGTADPVCKGLLLPEKGKSSKQKTSVCRKTLNPTWNHTLVFEDTSLQELTERALELSVWDHDRLGTSQFLGGCRLSLGKGKHGGRLVEWMEAAGMEVKLWEQMLERPNLWVEGSIMLRPTMDKPIYSSSMTE
ncbi:uncharacterized protein [Macrobrachium rosenbergii]|uniref:uncharacterized protein isoform X3 n=2 Tax=Macrobrachium rosenbergii TaxID=79674 RepID=UPI0034D3C6B1